MKRRSLVRILPPPLLCGHVKKNNYSFSLFHKKKFKTFNEKFTYSPSNYHLIDDVPSKLLIESMSLKITKNFHYSP
jgi:hypothetical protein